MSASAPRTSLRPWTGRVRPAGGWGHALSVAAAALVVIGSVGCNSPLMFNTPPGMGGGTGIVSGAGGGVGGGGAGQNGGTGGLKGGIGGRIAPPPPDAGADLPVDNGPVDTGVDVPTQPDVRPDIAPDRQPDVTPDLPRDTGVDAGGPVVCTSDTQCHFPTLALHCLIAGGQTTGSCVECAGDGDCATAGLRRCDTMAGSTTFHRCVECMNGTAATDCLSLTSDHPSTCNNEHHCLQGCDDSIGQGTCSKAGFVCQSSGGSEPDHQCADCLSQAECATGLRCINFVCLQCTLNTDCSGGQFCDNVAGNCVACRDSVDCRTPGFRLCNPAMHICVASN